MYYRQIWNPISGEWTRKCSYRTCRTEFLGIFVDTLSRGESLAMVFGIPGHLLCIFHMLNHCVFHSGAFPHIGVPRWLGPEELDNRRSVIEFRVVNVRMVRNFDFVACYSYISKYPQKWTWELLTLAWVCYKTHNRGRICTPALPVLDFVVEHLSNVRISPRYRPHRRSCYPPVVLVCVEAFFFSLASVEIEKCFLISSLYTWSHEPFAWVQFVVPRNRYSWWLIDMIDFGWIMAW